MESFRDIFEQQLCTLRLLARNLTITVDSICGLENKLGSLYVCAMIDHMDAVECDLDPPRTRQSLLRMRTESMCWGMGIHVYT